jgi:hypothetical protein
MVRTALIVVTRSSGRQLWHNSLGGGMPTMFSYGYVVKLPNGRLVRAGQDWGKTLDSYKVGDSLGVKDGKEGIVLAVVKGEEAKLNGYDVMIILEERAAKSEGQGVFQRIVQMSQELKSPRLTSRPQIQADFQGMKVRAVRNSIFVRPPNESLYDFQVNLLLWTLGKPWFDTEMAKPLEDRHIILRWRHERNELLNANRKPGDDPNKPVKAAMTGDVKALQILADDIYQLEHALQTPRRIIERLRDPRQFQGVRHEIAVASIFARCGFAINFIDDASKRNPEFIAEKGAERIAVEAKSRHRAGVLHQPGHFDTETNPAPAKIKDLYEQALGQNPGGMPFLVFVDINLPLSPGTATMNKSWVRESMQAFDDRRHEGKLTDPDTGMVLTNFGWHYYRDRGSPPGEFVVVRAEHTHYPIQLATWSLLDRALNEYGLIVDEEEHEKAVRARYPELNQ